MLYQSEGEPAFDPLADPEPKPALTLDLVPYIAKRTLRQFCPDTFRAVFDTAIQEGLTSKQTLKEKFGSKVVTFLKKPNVTPDPATCRELLSFISELDPNKATGSVEPHRHAKPKQDMALDLS